MYTAIIITLIFLTVLTAVNIRFAVTASTTTLRVEHSIYAAVAVTSVILLGGFSLWVALYPM